MNIRKQVLRAIQREPGIKTKDICTKLDITHADVWNACDGLLREGWIRKQVLPLPLRWHPTDKDLLS